VTLVPTAPPMHVSLSTVLDGGGDLLSLEAPTWLPDSCAPACQHCQKHFRWVAFHLAQIVTGAVYMAIHAVSVQGGLDVVHQLFRWVACHLDSCVPKPLQVGCYLTVSTAVHPRASAARNPSGGSPHTARGYGQSCRCNLDDWGLSRCIMPRIFMYVRCRQ
jgi:hypothetical protein